MAADAFKAKTSESKLSVAELRQNAESMSPVNTGSVMARPIAPLSVRWKWPPLSGVGIACRYVIAVPFLAVGALLLTIGALIAGSSSPSRKSGRPQRDPNCALEPKG